MEPCSRWSEAVSALADGEQPQMDPTLVEAHVARCVACRSFRNALAPLGRATSIAVAPDMPDLSRRIAGEAVAADVAERPSWLRWFLVLLGVQILVLSVEPLLLGDEVGTSPHGARHLGAFTAAYAIGLLVVAFRPGRARSMLPVAVVLGAATGISTVVDVINGQIGLLGEVTHVPELLSLPALWAFANPAGLARLRGSWNQRARPNDLSRVGGSRSNREAPRSGPPNPRAALVPHSDHNDDTCEEHQ